MAVDYEVACRENDLGALLAAAFLARDGARVLLLPPLDGDIPEPDFLLPVVRGYPAGLLADFIDLKLPATALFSWRKGSDVECWPTAAGFGEEFTNSEFAHANLTPELWPQLDRLWRLIDECMVHNLDMPANTMSGFWQMFMLLVRSELLRGSRNYNLAAWLNHAGISSAEQSRWHSFVPLISLFRFDDLPLLSFAYGIQTLLKPDGLIDIAVLKRVLREYLLAQGARQTAEKWRPVFDGKWYIGVGYDNQVSCRSTVYLANSSPEGLCREIFAGNQRRDFKRQLRLDDPGYQYIEVGLESDIELSGDSSLYHLNCSDSGLLSESELFTYTADPNSLTGDGKRVIRHGWRRAGTEKNSGETSMWGWRPHLPAMMGGGFLPLTGSLCRFYRVGWHNLPGFGLGGLIYSARLAASNVLKNELW